MTTPTTVPIRLKIRQDTAANWTSVNPTLLAGELGRESDTGKIKIGDGSTVWASLAYQPFGAQITNADISATAEIAVSKLADGAARQLLQTDAAGTGVEWASNIDVPGTLDVTGAATFDGNVTIQGDLTVNGTETIINTQTLEVEDKNIVIGKVDTPSDALADGGGITLKGTTDKTINWVDATDAWTSSEHIELASGKSYRINGTEVLSGTTLGAGVTGSSLTSVGTVGTGVWEGTAIDKTYLDATLVSTGDTGTVTSTMIADGTIVDGDINASAAIVDTKLATIATAGKVSNSATTATSANTNSAIVARDGSGNFSAGTITAALTGAASSNVLKAGDTMTGALVHPLGAAATPSITFTGDTNTGIYSPGADQVAVATNGTQRLTVDTAATTSTLPVVHPLGAVGTPSITFTGDLNTGFWSPTADTLAASTAGSERLRIDSSGRLLVGTSTASVNSRAVFQGRSDNAAIGPDIYFQRGQLNPAVNATLGRLVFADNASSPGAYIQADCDLAWGTGDYPTRLVFSTTADGASSPTERMSITQEGFICANTNTRSLKANAAAGGGFKFAAASSATSVGCEGITGATATRFHIAFTNGNGIVGTISTNGTATAYNTSSDYRLKENVTSVTDGITRLQQLKPSRFNFIADPDTTVDGFLAHEAAEVVPECVTGTKDEVDEDGNPLYQGIDQSKLVPLLTAALQEAIGEIESLKARVAALESA